MSNGINVIMESCDKKHWRSELEHTADAGHLEFLRETYGILAQWDSWSDTSTLYIFVLKQSCDLTDSQVSIKAQTLSGKGLLIAHICFIFLLKSIHQ